MKIESQAEIQQFGLQVRVHEDIGGLEVAVDHALVVEGD